MMHDSFRGYPAEWWGFMKGCPNKAMDSHIYQAWANPMIAKGFFDEACGMAGGLRTMEERRAAASPLLASGSAPEPGRPLVHRSSSTCR